MSIVVAEENRSMTAEVRNAIRIGCPNEHADRRVEAGHLGSCARPAPGQRCRAHETMDERHVAGCGINGTNDFVIIFHDADTRTHLHTCSCLT